MSQFPQDLDAEFQPVGERQMSGLAIGSIVCSLVCCVPGLPAIGALLGIASAVTISSNPQRKGMGLAIAAIIIGASITALQAWGGYQLYQFGQRLVDSIEEAPRQVFEPVNANDPDAFRDAFHGPGATASDDEVQAFIEAVQDRYGAYRSHQLDDTRGAAQPGMGDESFVQAYVVEFEHATVEADVEIIMADPNTGQFVFKPGAVRIIDPDRDDLEFPPGGYQPAGAATP